MKKVIKIGNLLMEIAQNVPFTASELQEELQMHKGKRVTIANEYPNREARRQDISPSNKKRYERIHIRRMGEAEAINHRAQIID